MRLRNGASTRGKRRLKTPSLTLRVRGRASRVLAAHCDCSFRPNAQNRAPPLRKKTSTARRTFSVRGSEGLAFRGSTGLRTRKRHDDDCLHLRVLANGATPLQGSLIFRVALSTRHCRFGSRNERAIRREYSRAKRCRALGDFALPLRVLAAAFRSFDFYRRQIVVRQIVRRGAHIQNAGVARQLKGIENDFAADKTGKTCAPIYTNPCWHGGSRAARTRFAFRGSAAAN